MMLFVNILVSANNFESVHTYSALKQQFIEVLGVHVYSVHEVQMKVSTGF